MEHTAISDWGLRIVELKARFQVSEVGGQRSEDRRQFRIADCGFRSKESGEREGILAWSTLLVFLKYFLHTKFILAIFPYFFLK